MILVQSLDYVPRLSSPRPLGLSDNTVFPWPCGTDSPHRGGLVAKLPFWVPSKTSVI